MNKETEKFLPGSESKEDFERVLYLLAEWIKGGIVSTTVDIDGDIEFRLPSEMSELLETQIPKDLKEEYVVSIIEFEIPMLIAAGLSSKPKEWLEKRLPKELSANLDSMTARSEKAVETLLNERTKERMLLRNATMAYVVDSVTWKKGTYQLEAGGEGKVLNVPHVSLEIVFSRPRAQSVMMLDFGRRGIIPKRADDICVHLELHQEDIKELIEKLGEIGGS